MRRDSRIFIVGHNDSVENSLKGHLAGEGFKAVKSNTADTIDVLSQVAVEKFFQRFQPEFVFLGSVRSGGIAANLKYPAEFAYENSLAQALVLEAGRRHKVKKLLYFNSSCTYPKNTQQPIKEESLLTGALESSSEPYALAKIAGVKLCQAYKAQYGFSALAVTPATLYGPGSDTDMETSHVLGALIAKFHQAVREGAKEVSVWGSGRPRREFLYVDDFAEACVFLMDRKIDLDLINIGCGHDVTIRQLAAMVKAASGFRGKMVFDASKPDGVMRKLMDNTRIRKLGWSPKVKLEEGIEKTYRWYRKGIT